MKKLLILMVVLGLTFGLTAFAASGKKGKPQTKCPICKMDINKNLYVDYKGKRVYFGCEGCPAEFKKNPEKYIKQMEKEGIVLENAPVKNSKMMKMNTMNNKGKNMTKCNMHKNMMNNNSEYSMNKNCNMSNMDKKSMNKKMMKNMENMKCTCTPEMKEKGQMCNYCKTMMKNKNMKTKTTSSSDNEKK